VVLKQKNAEKEKGKEERKQRNIAVAEKKELDAEKEKIEFI
jgi:hypothetical protein